MTLVGGTRFELVASSVSAGDDLAFRRWSAWYHAVRHLPPHRAAVVPGLPATAGRLLSLRPRHGHRIRHPGRSAMPGLHPAPRAGPAAPPAATPGQCARCLISQRLDELMGPSASLPPGLQALRHEIADAKHPVTAMRWLTKPAIAPVLSDLAAGRMPLTVRRLGSFQEAQGKVVWAMLSKGAL